MKARTLVLIAIVALFASLAPSAAYADLYDELDGNYDGEMWRNEVNADSNVGFDSPGTAYASVNLILSDIYQFNSDLLARGQSPAAQLAIQLTQLDFIRGAYGRLTQIKDQVEEIYLNSASINSALTQVNSYLGGMQYNLGLVKTAVQNLDSDFDTALSNQVAIANGLSGVKTDTNAIYTELNLLNQGIQGTSALSTNKLLQTIAANQVGISSQVRGYFSDDVDGNGTEGLIYGLLSDIEEHERYIHNFFRVGFDNFSSELMNQIDISTEQMIEVSDSVDANSLKLDDVNGNLADILQAIENLNFDVTFPSSISISNWPSFQPIIDAIQSLGNKLTSIEKALTDYDYTVSGEYGVNGLLKRLFNNINSFQGTATPVNLLQRILETLTSPNQYWNIDGKTYYSILGTLYRLFFNANAWQGALTPYWYLQNTYGVINSGFDELFDYLTNQDGVLKQIRDLLSVSNPDELVGDFDSVEFDTNVDDLVSRLATVAPFGALLMVSAELDILHSVSAIQQPSFVFPFEFFGQDTITIDLSFMADARPLFNFVVVFGFIYMLLIYSIDFIKEGEL